MKFALVFLFFKFCSVVVLFLSAVNGKNFLSLAEVFARIQIFNGINNIRVRDKVSSNKDIVIADVCGVFHTQIVLRENGIIPRQECLPFFTKGVNANT